LLVGVTIVISLLKSKVYFAQLQVSQKCTFCHQSVFIRMFLTNLRTSGDYVIQLIVFSNWEERLLLATSRIFNCISG